MTNPTLRIRNLRSLVDTGEISIRPLTILVGANSSGKSTFLRAFPLLRQSVSTPSEAPILWYGDMVDFGTFEDALCNRAEEDKITFEYGIMLKENTKGRRPRRGRDHLPLHEDVKVSVATNLVGHKDGRSKVSSADIYVEFVHGGEKHKCSITFDKSGNVKSFLVDDKHEFSGAIEDCSLVSGTLVPILSKDGRTIPFYGRYGLIRRGDGGTQSLIENLADEMKPFFHGGTKRNTRLDAAEKVGLGCRELWLDQLENVSRTKVWERNIKELNIDSQPVDKMYSATLARSIPFILHRVLSYFLGMAERVTYKKPFRAEAKRYYRIQDLSVNEVTPDGGNLAMFLRALSDGSRA